MAFIILKRVYNIHLVGTVFQNFEIGLSLKEDSYYFFHNFFSRFHKKSRT